jgi:hypothetical protein
MAETLGFALTTITSHFCLAFLAALAYRDSESYRILSDGLGLWICSAVLQHRRALFLSLG